MNQSLVELTPKMEEISPKYREILMLGNVLFHSGYFKDLRDQAQAVTKILWGAELGFSPIVSISGIHIIEGKPALSSNLMATLIKRSGKYDYRVKQSDETCCVLTFREKAKLRFEDVGVSEFSIEDARRAGVVKPGGSWARYPKAMLFARALSQGLRMYCPDVAAAPIYNPEEMGATVDEEGAVTELPKSARPVETIEEPVVMQKADGVFSKHIANVLPEKPNGGLGQAAASSPAPAAPTLEDLKAKLADLLPEVEPVDPTVYINDKQASHLRGRFRESLPEDLRDNSETLLHDFLAFHKFIGPDANPHIHLIPEADFKKVGRLAVAHARGLGADNAPF